MTLPKSCGLVAVGLAAALSCGCSPVAVPPPVGSGGRPSAEQLIDRLQGLGNKELATRTNIIRMGANGDEPMPAGLLMMQDAGPKPAEAMEELVRRGADSLPALIAHLDDGRKTRSTIRPVAFGLTFAAEFDRRHDEGLPPGVNDGHDFDDRKVDIDGTPDRDEYRLSVGDVCFTLIGRIVNREYEATRYQPSGIVIVNSPVLCPALRRAVAGRWGGLTAEQHRTSLVRDVVRPDWSERANAGVEVLARYFPGDVKAAVGRRLATPLYDGDVVKEFATSKLYVDTDAADRAALTRDFLVAGGAAARDGLVLQLWYDRQYPVGSTEPVYGSSTVFKVSPADVLAQVIGRPIPTDAPVINSADYRDVSDFVGWLRLVPYPLVERPVWEAFDRHATRHAADWANDDWIAEECVKVLPYHGRDDVLRAFCQRRLAEVGDDESKKFRIRPLIAMLDRNGDVTTRPTSRPSP